MSDMYSSHASTARLAQGTRLNDIFEIDEHIASGGWERFTAATRSKPATLSRSR